MKTGIELIEQERYEQINKHGWSLEHDQNYIDGQLVQAACFAWELGSQTTGLTKIFGSWPDNWYPLFELRLRNKSPIGQLAVAGAFFMAEQNRTSSSLYEDDIKKIAAEIDRLQSTNS